MRAALAGGERGSESLTSATVTRHSDPQPQVSIELVIGLGNPGERYAETRHNLGFRVVDELARRHADASWVGRALSVVTTARLGPRLVLAKPLTFMNRSGRAAKRLLHLLDLEPSQMLVIVDDVDLPLGTLRLRSSGSAGTHNGLRDVCDTVGDSFPRLRIGVRGDGPLDDLSTYVLSPFAEDEKARIPELVARAADAVETAVVDGLALAMNSYNRRDDRSE